MGLLLGSVSVPLSTVWAIICSVICMAVFVLRVVVKHDRRLTRVEDNTFSGADHGERLVKLETMVADLSRSIDRERDIAKQADAQLLTRVDALDGKLDSIIASLAKK